MCWSQPLVDGRDEDGRFVADREFVVARRHGAVPLEAIDPAFDRVLRLVVLGFELGRSAAARAALRAVGRLVGLVRNRAADSASPQIGAVLAGGVRLVGADAVRSGSRPSNSPAGDTDLVQDRLELRGVAALPGGDHDATSASGPAQQPSAAWWSGHRATGRGRDRPARRRSSRAAPSGGPPFPRPGGVLVGPADGGVDVEVPGDELLRRRPRPGSSAKIRCQVPSRCQRRNRSYDLAQGPYRSATSRHGTPVRVRNRMPSISCRLVHIGGRPGFLPRGNSGSRRAHCASVRSPRATKQDHLTSRSTSIHA